VAAFGRRVTDIFRQGEERVLRGVEAADAQVQTRPAAVVAAVAVAVAVAVGFVFVFFFSHQRVSCRARAASLHLLCSMCLKPAVTWVK